MTMMSSLKAFLFASPAYGAMTGDVAAPSVDGEGGDFAALLGEIAQAPAAPGPGGALPMPNPVSPVPAEGEVRALPLDMQALPAVDPLAMPDNGLPGEALSFLGKPDAATAETEIDGAPIETGDDTDQLKSDGSEDTVVMAATVAPPIAPLSILAALPVAPVLVPGEASMESPQAKSLAAVSVTHKGAEGILGKSVSSSMDGVDLPPSTAQPLTSQLARPSKASEHILPQSEMPAAATALPAGSGVVSSKASAPDRPIATSQAFLAPSIVQQALTAVSIPNAPAMVGQVESTMAFGAPAIDPALSMSGDSLAMDGTTAPAIMPVPNAPAPVKSEALSLLQLVREHFVRREAGASTEAATPAASPRTADPVAADNAPAAPLATFAPAPIVASAPTSVTGSIQAMPASVDLGGAIAGQVVDMGVQGQWIDGLAKDIASLSTEGAQGRFQVRSDHLGAVQVDIRPSATGTTVSLTVASDAAQQALQADGDRLIADAALSAMKITDLRVERGTISEAQRSDSAGQQNSQSQAQNQAQNGSQAMGQNLSQGMSQNRSGHRDNFSGNHKTGQDSAVLPQADSREGEATGARRIASRARYA